VRNPNRPLFQPPENEGLKDRCRRFAQQIADYEVDITDRSLLELTEIRKTLEAAAEALPA